jgi:hypothetical protein
VSVLLQAQEYICQGMYTLHSPDCSGDASHKLKNLSHLLSAREISRQINATGAINRHESDSDHATVTERSDVALMTLQSHNQIPMYTNTSGGNIVLSLLPSHSIDINSRNLISGYRYGSSTTCVPYKRPRESYDGMWKDEIFSQSVIEDAEMLLSLSSGQYASC